MDPGLPISQTLKPKKKKKKILPPPSLIKALEHVSSLTNWLRLTHTLTPSHAELCNNSSVKFTHTHTHRHRHRHIHLTKLLSSNFNQFPLLVPASAFVITYRTVSLRAQYTVRTLKRLDTANLHHFHFRRCGVTAGCSLPSLPSHSSSSS